MRIVCSIDDSAHARDAARIAGELALRLDAELVHIHSVTGAATTSSRNARCDLLIVGYRPRGRWHSALFGAAHRRLAEAAPCPVMLVPAGARLSTGARVVLGYDEELPQAVAATAGRLASALDAPLVTVAAGNLPRAAAREQAAVVVIAGPRRGLLRSAYGRLAAELERHAPHPVVIVPATA